MNLALTAEQREIAATAERFLISELPLSRVRELAAAEGPALDEATWARCAAAGWLALALPEDIGGVGLGATEQSLVFEQIGRHLAPGPFRSTVIAGHVAIAAGDEALAKRVAAGDVRCGTLVDDIGLDADADGLLLVTRGDSALLIEDYELTAIDGVDVGVRAARVTGGHVRATVNDPAIVARARLLAAAEAQGVIRAVQDMSARYAIDRIQFGVPIGTFQAVKHRCADMAIATYAVGSQVAFAARRLDDGCDDAPFQAAAAYLVAITSARRSVADNIQNHGAIGFTLEHDAHLYLRRAHTLEHALGSIRVAQDTVLAPERQEFR